MATVSTHVLDTTRGRPAAGVGVTLERVEEGGAALVARATTDSGGRVAHLGDQQEPGMLRLTFDTAAYGNPFYPEVAIVLIVSEADGHYHIPLLLSTYGYSTYRGS